MNNILILDGNQRSALAATRSIGQKGITVYVGETTTNSLAGSSKYCTQRVIVPNAETSPMEYVKALLSIISRFRVNILLPMTDISTATILAARDSFSNVLIPYPSINTYREVSNKSLLFKKAEALGFPVPKTIYINSPSQLTDSLASLSYPVVIKPSLSRIPGENQWVSTHVSVAQSESELLTIINRHRWLQDHSFMLQEFIHGEGSGVFTLYKKGKPVVFFSHRRIREKPPRGGVSVLSESIEVDPRMRKISEGLLDSVGWHGVAMIEFKVTPDGTPYLMEINGRFWGSLQLSIDSGVDFPYLTYLMAIEEALELTTQYTTGIKSRWLLGDLDRLYLVLKDKSGDYSTKSKLNNILEFLKLFSKGTHYEVNRMSDIKPFLFELKQYIKAIHHRDTEDTEGF